MNGRLYPKRKLILSALLLCTASSVTLCKQSWYKRVLNSAADHYVLGQKTPSLNSWNQHAILTAVNHVRGLSRTFSSSLAHTISSKLVEGNVPSISPSFDCITLLDGQYSIGTTTHEPDLFMFATLNEFKMPQEDALRWCREAKEYIDKTILHTGIKTTIDTVNKRYLLPTLYTHLGPEWETLAKFDRVNFYPSVAKKIIKDIRAVTRTYETALTGIGALALLKVRREINQFEQSITNRAPADSITIDFEHDLPMLYWYNELPRRYDELKNSLLERIGL